MMASSGVQRHATVLCGLALLRLESTGQNKNRRLGHPMNPGTGDVDKQALALHVLHSRISI